MRPDETWALAIYDVAKMTARAVASWDNMRKKMAETVQAFSSYRQGYPQMRTSTIGGIKAVIQDTSKSEGNSTVDELGKFRASTPSRFAIQLISNDKITSAHRIDIAGIISSILATPITAQPAR